MCCSREIAVGSVAIFNGRAQVDMGFVMLVCSRKIVYRCVKIYICQSEDHYGLLRAILRTKNAGLSGPLFCLSSKSVLLYESIVNSKN